MTHKNRSAFSAEKVFLLRMWNERKGEWRFLVEVIGQEDRRVFDDVKAMTGYLVAHLRDSTPLKCENENREKK